eukprot:TRINITY_DN51504_c0_g1_i1.p1 TRINITY_DN51504_c0_g1~~TRINITY_DN51504_c0_g1_i1.p1  ORF type:complete len:393 (+),score=59.31 TRINITY_DN51504_c0_g1_i1:58-1236(+)
MAAMWFFCSVHLHLAAAALPLAPVLRSAVSSEDAQLIQQASKLAQDAHHNAQGTEYVQHRVFGVGKNATVGHSATFLHDHIHLVDDALLDRLLTLAPKLMEKGGWLYTDSLRVRCVEVIVYDGGEHSDANTGWHTDGASMLTIAAMLSNKAAYQGGSINLRSEDGLHLEQHELDAGDAIAWRGWTDHQVEPVTAGRREVLVIELWTGADARISTHPRDCDNPQALRDAGKADPTSAQVQRLLGRSLCKSLPCTSPEVALEAEFAFREALRLQPEYASAHLVFGMFLLGSFRLWATGLFHLRESCMLDPDRRFSAYHCSPWSLYLALRETAKVKFAHPSLNTDVEEQHNPTENALEVFYSLIQAALVIVVLAVIMPLVLYLERHDRVAAKKAA